MRSFIVFLLSACVAMALFPVYEAAQMWLQILGKLSTEWKVGVGISGVILLIAFLSWGVWSGRFLLWLYRVHLQYRKITEDFSFKENLVMCGISIFTSLFCGNAILLAKEARLSGIEFFPSKPLGWVSLISLGILFCLGVYLEQRDPKG